MIDLTKALTYLRPDESWSLNGDNYDGLTWLAETTKPTQEELEAAYPMAIAAIEEAKSQKAAARAAAIEHAKSLGFTDEMIAVMYPNLGDPNE